MPLATGDRRELTFRTRMIHVNRDFLSCDWGTTSLRLRWVNGRDLTIVREVREPVGIKSLHEEAIRTGATGDARAEVFARCLREKLETLLAGAEPPLPALPLMISGM